MRHDHHAPKSPAPWLFVGISALVLAVTGSSGIAAPGKPTELGLWYNHSGRGAVEIRPCGATGRDANRLCGFIVWLKDPNNKKGEPLKDGYNEETSKRRRPICGLPVLGSLRPMSDGSWDEGWVYDPEQGKSFDAAIQLKSADRLILTGYKGIKFFSKSFVWKRAPSDLPRCDGSAEREARASIGTTQPAAAKPPQAQQPAKPDTLTPPRPVPAWRATTPQTR